MTNRAMMHAGRTNIGHRGVAGARSTRGRYVLHLEECEEWECRGGPAQTITFRFSALARGGEAIGGRKPNRREPEMMFIRDRLRP